MPYFDFYGMLIHFTYTSLSQNFQTRHHFDYVTYNARFSITKVVKELLIIFLIYKILHLKVFLICWSFCYFVGLQYFNWDNEGCRSCQIASRSRAVDLILQPCRRGRGGGLNAQRAGSLERRPGHQESTHTLCTGKTYCHKKRIFLIDITNVGHILS